MHSSAMIAANALTTTEDCNSVSATNTVFLPGRYYAVGGLCLACGVQVHTRPRLIHHLNHGTTECLAQYITNRHPFHNDEVERLDAIDRANRKTLRAVGLRETHAPHPATRLPYATSFVLPPDEDALLEARPPAGPSVLCDTPLPAVPGCFRFQKGVLPLVIIFAQGPRSVSDLQVHLEALRLSRGVPVFCAYVDTLANTPFADVGLRDNISFWLDLILSGRVCAVIALSGRSIWHSSDYPQAFRCKHRFWGALTLPEIQHENVERDNELFTDDLLGSQNLPTIFRCLYVHCSLARHTGGMQFYGRTTYMRAISRQHSLPFHLQFPTTI